MRENFQGAACYYSASWL